jgi:hypothetical protein
MVGSEAASNRVSNRWWTPDAKKDKVYGEMKERDVVQVPAFGCSSHPESSSRFMEMGYSIHYGIHKSINWHFPHLEIWVSHICHNIIYRQSPISLLVAFHRVIIKHMAIFYPMYWYENI